MSAVSSRLTSSAKESFSRTQGEAAAVEEMSENMMSVSVAMKQTTANVNTVCQCHGGNDSYLAGVAKKSD